MPSMQILGCMLLCTLASASDPVWTFAPSLPSPRYGMACVTLEDGSVVVAGGADSTSYATKAAQRYRPGVGWSTTGTMAWYQFVPSACLLADGRAMVGGAGQGEIGKCEIYDPSTNLWTAAANFPDTRNSFTWVVLHDGRVLMAGGLVSAESLTIKADCWLYDPSQDAWTVTGSMGTARFGHTATLLGNGKVLVVGGHDDNANTLNSCEMYDPATNQWSPAASLVGGVRMYHQALRLTDGRVLVAGGSWNQVHTELFDPANNTWILAGDIAAPRSDALLGQLRGGRVLFAAGSSYTGSQTSLTTSEVWNPEEMSWSPGPPLNIAHRNSGYAMLPSGSALVVGGVQLDPWSPLGSVEFLEGGPVVAVDGPTTVIGEVGAPLTVHFSVVGAYSSYTASGLPNGLTLNAAASTITGTPTAAGTSHIVVMVGNTLGISTATITLTVNPPAPDITSALSVDGTVGVAFSYQITGSNTPTSFDATGLPAGLSMDGAGLISGIPTVAGEFTCIISATNAGGTGSASLTVTISESGGSGVSSGGGGDCGTGTVGVLLAYALASLGLRVRRRR